jgi:site-specific recombinase XerD
MTAALSRFSLHQRPGAVVAREVAATRSREQHPPRPVQTSWPQTTLSRDALEQQMFSGVFVAANEHTQRGRARAVRSVLDWLESLPGQTWQQRWLASGADTHGARWIELACRWRAEHGLATADDKYGMLHAGLLPIVCSGTIRPSYEWMLKHKPTKLLVVARQTTDPDGFARLGDWCDQQTGLTLQARRLALNRVTWIVLRHGGRVADVTIGDLLELRDAAVQFQSRTTEGFTVAYQMLHAIGVFPATAPARLQDLHVRGQMSIEELVDRYPIVSQPVRTLIIEYLRERSPRLDYTSLSDLARTLAAHFWADLEAHHPGIDNLHLPAQVASDWKQRIRHVPGPDGPRLRAEADGILVWVRAFYRDLAHWAADDPARWAQWAVPCPIRKSDIQRVGKRVGPRKARMDQRTRSLLPVLPALVRHIEQTKDLAARLLTAAQAAPPGGWFDFDGRRYRRLAPAISSPRAYITDPDTNRRRDLNKEEDSAFWSWAILETLRHTGMRLEELNELSHHSFVSYTLPTTGEVVPLLQIAPSKTDAERLILVSPELGETLAAIIHRVRGGTPTLPLIRRYDPLEKLWQEPMPLLFQHRRGVTNLAISRSLIGNLLHKAVAAAKLTGAGGHPLTLTPHDMRRAFITDAILSGLPPHIAQVICGHANINVTMGYKAIYPEEAITAHRAFIARRRQLRPSEEYRDLTPEEWDEFLGHFELRKVSLGVCTRDFGTPCMHEHACVRCPALRPDPDQAPRLKTIIANLNDRIAEARQHGWLGEIAGLETSLTAANQKLATMQRLADHHRVTHLGMPSFTDAVGRTNKPRGHTNA